MANSRRFFSLAGNSQRYDERAQANMYRASNDTIIIMSLLCLAVVAMLFFAPLSLSPTAKAIASGSVLAVLFLMNLLRVAALLIHSADGERTRLIHIILGGGTLAVFCSLLVVLFAPLAITAMAKEISVLVLGVGLFVLFLLLETALARSEALFTPTRQHAREGLLTAFITWLLLIVILPLLGFTDILPEILGSAVGLFAPALIIWLLSRQRKQSIDA